VSGAELSAQLASALTLSSFSRSGVAVTFGSSGAIGGATADQLAADGSFDNVIGFSRSSSPEIELLDEASLERAAAFVSQTGELRLVVDATGFLHDEREGPQKNWRDLDTSKLARAFALNAIGPALIMKSLLPLLPRMGKSVFATLSARVGSIGDNQLGSWYGYRASKAALIQLVRTAAIELRRQWPDAVCVALHPETVATRLSSPFPKSGLEVNTPRSAAHHLLTVIDSLPSALMRLLRLSQGIRYPGSPNDQKAPPSRLAADESRALLARATSNVSPEIV
jgi:NAD(P)-dependent dehydrogenase (short-subunit alcohol dehydrogenase family)